MKVIYIIFLFHKKRFVSIWFLLWFSWSQSFRELYPLNISFSALKIKKFRIHFQKIQQISSSFHLGLYFKPDQHVMCCLWSIFCENCVDKCRINVILLMFLSIFLKLDSDYNFGGNYENKNVENQQRYFQRKTKMKYLQSWAHFYASWKWHVMYTHDYKHRTSVSSC